MKKIIILFSGEGSNMAQIIKQIHNKHANIVCTITNNPTAGGITISKAANIPVLICDNTLYTNREEYDTALVQLIQEHSPDLVVLAGFMRILTPVFTGTIRSINLHPSLLPAYKGARAIQQSFGGNEPFCGVTVHWVSEELDGGEIILQKSFMKNPKDSLEEFTAKIRAIEYEILPQAIVKILEN